MNELNEVYASYDSKNREYSKEEYAEYKRKEKEQVYQMIDTTAEQVVKDGNVFQLFGRKCFASYSTNATSNTIKRLRKLEKCWSIFKKVS